MVSTVGVHDPNLLHLVVASRKDLAEGVVLLRLVDPDGAALPQWEPGAHVNLHIGEPWGARQYSLCSSPCDRHAYEVAVLRESAGRGGSRHVHDELREGDRVLVARPRNSFALVDATRYVFVAGGIGITPMLPMIERAERVGASWTLLYGGRSRRSMAFVEMLRDAEHGRVLVRPQDEHGLLDLSEVLPAPAGEVVYCCGPEPLLAAVREHMSDWPAGSLHIERFSPDEEALARPTTAFEVAFAQSGISVEVPADGTIVDAAEAAGVPVVFSCMEGTCGSCETPVLEGDVDHRDSLLTEEERARGDVMMICVSRAGGRRLVLDL